MEYDNKESTIQIDTLREQIDENEREIEDLRRQMEAIKISAKDAAAEEKERRKAEKMAAMMAKFDAVSLLRPLALRSQLTLRFLQEGTLSEKEDAIRVTLAKLHGVDPEDPSTALTQEDVTMIYRQLSERQALLRESNDKLRHAQTEGESVNRRREEIEQRLETLEAEYEELLGSSLGQQTVLCPLKLT